MDAATGTGTRILLHYEDPLLLRIQLRLLESLKVLFATADLAERTTPAPSQKHHKKQLF